MNRILSVGLILSLASVAPLFGFDEKGLSGAGAGRNTVNVSPDVLSGMVLDQSVRLMMRDGTYVEGKVFRASQDSITLKVNRSEPKGRIRGPDATLSSSEISVVFLRKSGTIAAPIALGILGGFAGGLATSYAAYALGGESTAAGIAVLGGITGGACGGALLGREAAKRTLTINVISPSQQASARSGDTPRNEDRK